MTRLPNGERLFSIGHGIGTHHRVAASQIEEQVRVAVAAGQSLNEACPYPFFSDAGQYFKAVFLRLGGKP